MIVASSGVVSTKRAQFLTEHPICCFCGGNKAAEEMDHVPARSVFKGRSWPEGYVFPSCSRCNQGTRLDEILFSLLCRMHPDPSAEREAEEVRALFQSIKNNFPGLLESLQPSAREVRRFLKKTGVTLPRGMSLSEVPILKTDHPRLRAALRKVANKVGLALFYKHAGRIVPTGGSLAIAFFTNTTFKPQEWPANIFEALKGQPKLKRARTEFESQFNYQFALTEAKDFGGFVVRFPTSIAFLIAVDCTSDRGSFVENDDLGRWIERPFSHTG